MGQGLVRLGPSLWLVLAGKSGDWHVWSLAFQRSGQEFDYRKEELSK